MSGVLHIGYVIPGATGILDVRVDPSTHRASLACAFRWDHRGSEPVPGAIDIDVLNLHVLSSLTTDEAVQGLIAAINCFRQFAERSLDPRHPIDVIHSDRGSWPLAEALSAATRSRLTPLDGAAALP